MNTEETLGPAISVALLTLLSALPWGLPPEIRFVLPLIPIIGIHFWITRAQGLLSEWFVFACGLLLDVLTNGPLGFWSGMYLLAFVFSTLAGPRARQLPLGGWATFVLIASVLAVTEWAVSSVYYLELADWRPLAVAAFAAVVLYPPVAFLLAVLVGRSHRMLPGTPSYRGR